MTCRTIGGRQGGVGSAGLGRLPRCGFGRVSGGACVGGVGTAGTRRTAIGEGLWTGTWMPEVDRGRGEVSGSRGLGGGEGGVFFSTERAAVQERVAAWVWRLEREKATWRSF